MVQVSDCHEKMKKRPQRIKEDSVPLGLFSTLSSWWWALPGFQATPSLQGHCWRENHGLPLSWMSQAHSFLKLRTPARQGEPPFPGAESCCCLYSERDQSRWEARQAWQNCSREGIGWLTLEHESHRLHKARPRVCKCYTSPNLSSHSGERRPVQTNVLGSLNPTGPTSHGFLLLHMPKDDVIATILFLIIITMAMVIIRTERKIAFQGRGHPVGQTDRFVGVQHWRYEKIVTS